MGPNYTQELMHAMRGHIDGHCGENCIHLQRVLAIKHKFRGVPYPINITNIL